MSRLSASPYPIATPTGLCAATGRALATGEPIVVALVERSDDLGLERLDFAADAWDAGARDPHARPVFAHWRTLQPEPNAKPKLFIDDAALMDLFQQLGEESAPGSPDAARRRVAFRFVLALVLCRKRLLTLESSLPGAMLVRVRGGGPETPLLRVDDPGLDDDALAACTESLGEILNAES